jgi:hypothetical protein
MLSISLSSKQKVTAFYQHLIPVHNSSWAGTAQSVQRLATGWKIWGLNPGGG